MTEQLVALVVDDTITYRALVSDAVDALPFATVGERAPTGEIALKKLAASRFDLVLLDVEMPGIGGLETLGRIKRDFPDVDVVMVSGVSEHAASTTIKAMNAGAFEFVRKPIGPDAAENATELKTALQDVLKAVWLRRRMRGAVGRTDERPAQRRIAPVPTRFGVLGIGISTGGPNALARVIPALPRSFPLPVVVVQHMPAPFTKALAADLNRKSELVVREGKEGDILRPGLALIAPGSRHMVVRKTANGVTVGVNDGPKENSCRPAVDVLFRALAACYGDEGVLAAIMTGMGSDGKKGVEALKRKGCYCITQSETTCVVYGMPQAVDAAGLSDESVDLDKIAERIVALARKGAG